MELTDIVQRLKPFLGATLLGGFKWLFACIGPPDPDIAELTLTFRSGDKVTSLILGYQQVSNVGEHGLSLSEQSHYPAGNELCQVPLQDDPLLRSCLGGSLTSVDFFGYTDQVVAMRLVIGPTSFTLATGHRGSTFEFFGLDDLFLWSEPEFQQALSVNHVDLLESIGLEPDRS